MSNKSNSSIDDLISALGRDLPTGKVNTFTADMLGARIKWTESTENKREEGIVVGVHALGNKCLVMFTGKSKNIGWLLEKKMADEVTPFSSWGEYAKSRGYAYYSDLEIEPEYEKGKSTFHHTFEVEFAE